ncbi:hypothetical protein H5410_016608, partial [Solanum commersonii]
KTHTQNTSCKSSPQKYHGLNSSTIITNRQHRTRHGTLPVFSRNPLQTPNTISHCAYPVVEIAFTQGESRVFNVAEISSEKEISHGDDETNLGIGARRKGKFDASSKSHVQDDDDNPISKLLPKRLRSRLKKMSGKPVVIPRDESPKRVQPSVAVPVCVTRSTQKLLDKGLELLVAKTPRIAKGKTRKKMGREETRQFYINASGTLTSISSVVNGRAIVLMTDVISRILGIPNLG